VIARGEVLALVAAIPPVETALDEFLTLAKGRGNRRAAAWAGEHAASEISDLSTDARAEVRDLVQAALEDGWTTAELAGELVDLGFDADRAETIASNEMRTARNAGLLEGWTGREDAAQQRKVWTVGADPCPLCLQVDGQQQFLEEPFDTELGPVDHPPLHPGCKCRMTLVAA
jgi:hypothetical protein